MARHDPRDYVLGQELIAKILATGAQTWGVTTSSTRSNFPAPSRPCICTPVRRKAWSSLKAPALWVGSDMVQLHQGDFYVIPLNTQHAIKAGPNGCRSLLISSPAGFAELIARAATPAHLAGLDTKIDLELFTSVSTELGDQILGPPDTLPTDS